jgi:2-polyprenyl-3-methyl-5-hydroxy-6-metoxy-1,4-benzoquinol methylase
METNQQKETQNYFDAFAKDWKEKAQGQKQFKVNVINQRNGYVVEVIKSRNENIKTLDVGCGTGELVHDIARLGIDAVGIDFANEMIKEAQGISIKENLANATFLTASIFDFPVENDSLDVISANGFIEYISHEQLDQFFENSHKQLRKNGSLVFGTRNRLFNIVSMNQYTLDEIESGNLDKLAIESVRVAGISNPEELLNTDTVELEPATRKHTNTGGIEVTTRFQFTPAQLVKMLHAKGFTVKELCPVHIHGLSPNFAADHKEAHYNVSNLLSNITNEEKQNRYKLIPYASSFMVHAVK